MSASRVVEGKEGYIQLANPLNVESDIGGWIIEDGAGKRFFVPSKTKIAAGGELSLSNAVTGLLQDGTLYPVTIQYPNGTVALTHTPATSSQRAEIPIISAAHEIPGESVANASSSRARSPSPLSPRPKTGRDPDTRDNAPAKNITETGAMPATIATGFSVSSRMMFAGAIGLSVLGALGFFVLKHFLI
jgi:hypothetical protein